MNVYTLSKSLALFCRRKSQETYIFVHESRVGALPRGDATATTAKCHKTRLNPCSAKAVEEVGLASNFVLVEVCVSEFANVNLRHCQILVVVICSNVRSTYRILIRVEPGVIEPSICIAHRYGERWPCGIFLVIIDEV